MLLPLTLKAPCGTLHVLHANFRLPKSFCDHVFIELRNLSPLPSWQALAL